jgi:hypothetical protein
LSCSPCHRKGQLLALNSKSKRARYLTVQEKCKLHSMGCIIDIHYSLGFGIKGKILYCPFHSHLYSTAPTLLVPASWLRDLVTVDMMVVALLATSGIRWSPTQDRQVSAMEDVIVLESLYRNPVDDYSLSRLSITGSWLGARDCLANSFRFFVSLPGLMNACAICS